MVWSRCFRFAQILCVAVALQAETPLVLLTEPWPPYITQNEQGQVSGLHTEIVLAVFKEMRREVRIEIYPWKRCLSMMEGRQGDAIFTLNKNPERERFLYFPHQPVAESPSVFFVLTSNARRFRYESFKDLVGLKIGVTNGKAYEGGLLDQKDLTFEIAVRDEMNIAKLASGRIDLWPSDLYVGYDLINQVEGGAFKGRITHLPKHLNHSNVYIGFARKPGYQDLAERFDAALAKLRKNGVCKAIEAKYAK